MATDKPQSLQDRIHEIIFEADTPWGKAFDVSLLILIIVSVLVVILESVEEFQQQVPDLFFYTEWVLTILFTIEYGLRIYSIQKPWKYITSFYGIVDLLAILPTYLSLFFFGTQYLITIRSLRLLRTFRILKISHYLSESAILMEALKSSRRKIEVFIGVVVTIVLIIGSIMYVIEGKDSGFTSIPRSMYWAVVTVTTVGYGDIYPVTTLGQFLSAILMIMGYGVIAVPTGIVSVELAHAAQKADQPLNTKACPVCSMEGHDSDAEFCKYCAGKL